MRTLNRTGLVMALAVTAPAQLLGQRASPPPGVPYLFVLDLAGTALDEFPSAVKALNGTMTVVDRDGQHMLRASSPSELLITLPQALPADFTVEVDLIPKSCCAPEDLMLEGTPARNRGVASAELTWQSTHIMAVGGGGEMYQSDMPADLAASTPGSLTRVVVTFSGTTVKLYTNGRRMYTLDKQFARGRVIRVWLGGQDEGVNAVYLAGLRIGMGPAAPGVIAGGASQPGDAGGGGVSSNPQIMPPPGQPAPPPGLPTGSTSYVPAPPTAGSSGSGSSYGPPPPAAGSSGSTGTSPYVPPPPGSGTASSSQALIGPTPSVVRMAPTVTQGNAGPLVQWAALNGATGYRVKRWKSNDLTCCNNASGTLAGPPWQDAALRSLGTYVYEVTATMTAGVTVAEQTQFSVLTVPVPSSPSTIAGPTAPTATSGPVLSAPIAAQSGVPVQTAPAPGYRTPAALAPTGPPPSNLMVTGTPSLAKLNWSSGVSGLRGVTYRVERWLESNPTCCAAQSATLTFPAWTDEGLLWPGTYVFRITELYPDGTFGEATTRYVRPDPVNPANFRPASVSAGFVGLRWDTVPDAGWYELSGPGLGSPTFHATIGAFNVHDLSPGTYTWRVGTFYSSPNAPGSVSTSPSAFPSVTVTVP